MALEKHERLMRLAHFFKQVGDGLELKHPQYDWWAILLPDASEPGRYRYQEFDRNGFTSHSTYDSPGEAIKDLASREFVLPALGTLEALSTTRQWARGQEILALVQAVNWGQLPWEEAHVKRQEINARYGDLNNDPMSLPPSKLLVDGVIRSTVNAKGEALGKSADDIGQFWKWFGNSQTVDIEGRPLVLYHGTRRQFEQFELNFPRGAIGNPEGVYFDTKMRVAEEFAQDVDGAMDDRSRIIEAYVKIVDGKDGDMRFRVERGVDELEVIEFCAENIRMKSNRVMMELVSSKREIVEEECDVNCIY